MCKYVYKSICLSKMISNILYTACVSYFLLCMLQAWTNAEFYSAIAQMEPLLKTQKQIIEVLDKYLMEEENRIAVLKSHLRVYKVEHEKAMEDIPDYLGNPINAFMFIKRLTTDLEDIGHNIRRGIENSKNISMSHYSVKYPTLEDLAGAAQALTRLQTTYRLDVRDLAEGVLNGVQGHPMTAADCFEVARTVYIFREFKNTIAWSMEALRKFRKESNIAHTMTESEIVEYIVFSHFFIGDVKSALEWTKILLELDPDHPQAHVNMLHFEKTITEQEKRKEKKQNSVMGEQSMVDHTNDVSPYTYDTKKYEALCRGEVEVPGQIAKRLRCRYLTEHHPFLLLAPLKVEQMYIQPDVYVFHEVISDEEIESIKNLSLPRVALVAKND
ncbi:prolyl 4-hydroxylase subunit alpha-1-like [Choristoneura fumiferana]|uniref:prolyl 4-hydroxylase subunit alpha-1-like n=1 Tax=Choristoneura fumiferana TaxID=7141 RepID=UPI003D156A8A